jgi:hypothetical protein
MFSFLSLSFSFEFSFFGLKCGGSSSLLSYRLSLSLLCLSLPISSISLCLQFLLFCFLGGFGGKFGDQSLFPDVFFKMLLL